ncbi:6-phosphogluconolactonase [Candidatus Peribacteria bacterium]|nr:6-phosphogluconolactonase [Candidatus Peribacteria bacterium]
MNSILWCVTDERVNCTIQERNDEHIWEVFLSPLFSEFHVSDKNFIRPMIESDGFEYSQRVENIDIAFFGMGPDGHTASLFPHHPGLESSDV